MAQHRYCFAWSVEHSGARPGNDRISKFSKSGKFLKSWGKRGSGNDELNAPHTIAFDSAGRLLVGDRNNNRIQIFDQEGRSYGLGLYLRFFLRLFLIPV